MDELEKRFGLHLRLSDNERGGLRIEDGESIDVLKGSQYTLVAKVFTLKAVHREGCGWGFYQGDRPSYHLDQVYDYARQVAGSGYGTMDLEG
ncbi:hypothetical protein Pyn_11075 [Prunus yedoensis var. nudiflora]|uniref:Uncharacterized protein n=1 Tax=Prunus yedoensis var. nudiflora TaxID=2094558 RepID=A0A314ZD70_PRUYE|nr:hypothetical protein Pyn_11075 [Prunus yedoensis var. nudiflora]